MAPRDTSLGPKPSFFFGFVLFCFLVFLCLEKVCFPPAKKEGSSVHFSVSPFVFPLA